MTNHSKYLSLLFLVGTLVAFILLTASLSNLDLQPGTPFPGGIGSGNDVQSVSSPPPTQIYFIPLLRGIFALIFIVFLIDIAARLVALVNIKRILQLTLALVILLIIIYMLPRITPNPPAYLSNRSSAITTPSTFDYPVTPLGRPPRILIQLVIIGIVSGLGWLAFIVVKRRRSSKKIEDDLLQEAEQAVNALKAGADLRNVILRCYFQMTRSLQEEQGIERDHTMTVQEFERWLGNLGFPSIPLRQLTSLFEKVRYGKQQTNNTDEKIALDSLNEIIQFCRSERG
jgi:Domain of unknown function (DUF4129)